MKLESEYIKQLLLGIEHYEVLFDYGFIEPTDESGRIGIEQKGYGEYFWINLPIRLTAQGHEFIEAMQKNEVWEVVKKEFKDNSIKTIFDVATGLAEGFARKKLEKYLE
jgi:hypothetical protein